MTVLAALAARAASEPEEPWLFYRRGWDWRWRSWGQVADQAARGAAALGRSPALASRVDARVAFDGRQDPDAVAGGLAVQAAGVTAVPRSEGALRPLEVAVLAAGVSGVRLRLPACRSRLERWRPQALDLDAAAAGALAFDPASAAVPPEEISAEAERLAGRLPDPAGGRRPILCASPALDPWVLQTLLAWTVGAAAAWVLEPDVEALPAAARWARPTLVVATGGELGPLASALGGRQHRRYRRLAAVVAVGEAVGREGWEALGVPVVEWGPVGF